MMGYEISSVEGNRIIIRHDFRDALDGIIMLMKSIEGELDGRIVQMDGDDVRYTIQKDPYNLIYSWDAMTGLTVIVDNLNDMDDVIDMLLMHFEKLNS